MRSLLRAGHGVWRAGEPARGGQVVVELCLPRRPACRVQIAEQVEHQMEGKPRVDGKDKESYLEGLSVEGVVAEGAFIPAS